MSFFTAGNNNAFWVAYDGEEPQGASNFLPRCELGKDGEGLPAEGVRWLNSELVFIDAFYPEHTPQSKDLVCLGIP